MILTADKIGDFIHGSLGTEVLPDGYLRFRRFTDRQTEVIIRRKFAPRQFATPCVRLEFDTRGGEISLKCRFVRGSGGQWYGTDLLCDGYELFHLNGKGETDVDSISAEIPSDGALHRVTLYFTNLAGMEISDVSIPDDAEPTVKKKKILMLGDSITHGAFTTHTHMTYANLFCDMLDAEVLNQGIGGDIYCSDNIDVDLPFDPDFITVAYGTNDWRRAAGNIPGEVKAYYDRMDIYAAGRPVFVMLPIWRSSGKEQMAGLTLADVRSIIAEEASKHPNCHVLRSDRYVHPSLDLYVDGLHPNALGFTIMARKLYADVTGILN